MITGVRSVPDARKRAMMHPQVQAYWNEIDCGFQPVADVFEEEKPALMRLPAAGTSKATLPNSGRLNTNGLLEKP